MSKNIWPRNLQFPIHFYLISNTMFQDVPQRATEFWPLPKVSGRLGFIQHGRQRQSGPLYFQYYILFLSHVGYGNSAAVFHTLYHVTHPSKYHISFTLRGLIIVLLHPYQVVQHTSSAVKIAALVSFLPCGLPNSPTPSPRTFGRFLLPHIWIFIPKDIWDTNLTHHHPYFNTSVYKYSQQQFATISLLKDSPFPGGNDFIAIHSNFSCQCAMLFDATPAHLVISMFTSKSPPLKSPRNLPVLQLYNFCTYIEHFSLIA